MGFVFLEDIRYATDNTCKMVKEVCPQSPWEQKMIKQLQASDDKSTSEVKLFITARNLYQVRNGQVVRKSLTKKQD